jgi:hypothetical protein
MPYIKFNDDPLAKRVSAAFANLCASLPAKKMLRVIDKCFIVFNQSKKEASFCELENMIYPVDTQLSINFEICAGETLSLFDNALEDILITYVEPSTDFPENHPLGKDTEFIEATGTGPSGYPGYYILANDRNYARGILLYVKYPALDKNGLDILPADHECEITVTNRDLTSHTMPMYEFFAHFANPETRAANSLINKIEMTNNNADFSIIVTGLIIYTKSNTDPSDCAC